MNESVYPYAQLIFSTIEFLIFVSLIYAGSKVSKIRNINSYWHYSSIAIIIYTLGKGLRFGRPVDYNLYCERYYDIGKYGIETSYEPLFQLICSFFNFINLPYFVFILFCSFMIIYSSFRIAKPYYKAALFIFPLFLIVTYSSEMLIRWYLAFSFYLIGLDFFIKSNYTKSFLWFIASACIHFGIIVVILLTIIGNLYNKKILSPKIVVILFTLTMFIGDLQWLHFFDSFIYIFSINEKAAFYVDNYTNIIDGTWKDTFYLELPKKIRLWLAYAIPIFYLNRTRTNIPPIFYNLFFIGVISLPLFLQVEILNRYNDCFLFFAMIVIGMFYKEMFMQFKKLPTHLKIGLFISIFCIYWSAVSYIFDNRPWYNMLFIWDDFNNKEKLPLYLFSK